VAPRLKEAVQWINQAADEHARKVRAEFFEAVDEVIEFLDERRDADSEGCNTDVSSRNICECELIVQK
jgi:ABC-type nitrate/sulfonate/bicarbonate transport system substrate-binding protein